MGPAVLGRPLPAAGARQGPRPDQVRGRGVGQGQRGNTPVAPLPWPPSLGSITSPHDRRSSGSLNGGAGLVSCSFHSWKRNPRASSSLARPAIRAPWDLPIRSRGLLLPSLQSGPPGELQSPTPCLLRTPGPTLPAALGSQVSPRAPTVRVGKGVQRRSEPPRGLALEDASPRHEGCYFCEVHLQNTSVNFLYLFIHSKNLN